MITIQMMQHVIQWFTYWMDPHKKTSFISLD